MMLKRFGWVRPYPDGLYIAPADCWIDPAKPVRCALITHGHADHARGGHGRVIATAETLAIMALRYGAPETETPRSYGDPIEIGGGVTACWIPAGHVLGSAQIILEKAGERVVVTGDYKRRADPTCPAFVPVVCDILITEATFGLPLFRHPPIETEIQRILDALLLWPERALLIGAYALGKAQRLISELRRAGYMETIYLHGAMDRMCRLYQSFGIDLGPLCLVSETPKAALAGKIIVCPPSALNDRWARRLPDPLTAMASGWMQVRQRARQRNVELPLIISDHADWAELTDTIAEIRPEECWITHGREEALLRWCALNQQPARALSMAVYDDEDD